jgi:hypothetical protein
MDFLDTLTDQQSETTFRRLNYMISVALISPEEKTWYEMNAFKLTETEAKEHIAKLEQSMPIMGYHSIPQDVKQCVEATRLRVERDNFFEQRWKKI